MPRSSREKSVETRTHIVDAAYHLFVDKGYNATPMREISQHAGVTVGAVYNHFATKEDIWKAVLDEKHPYHEILPLIQSVDGETVSEVISTAARLLVHELMNRPDLFNLMFIEIVEFQAVHVPDLYTGIVPHLLQMQKVFEGKKGKLRDIPLPVILRSFVGLFFSYFITGVLLKTLPEITTDETTLDQIIELYLKGVLADDDPSRIKRL